MFHKGLLEYTHKVFWVGGFWEEKVSFYRYLRVPVQFTHYTVHVKTLTERMNLAFILVVYDSVLSFSSFSCGQFIGSRVGM